MLKIKTKRLVLRPLSKGDEDNLMKIFSDPIAMTFYLGTKTVKEAEEWIAKASNLHQTKKMGFFACELLDSGEFVGICGLLPQSPNGQEEVEVGYLFVRKYWGQGYATEAARACMDYGFHTLGLSKIISLIDPKNEKSINVAKRNGLKLEGETVYKGRRALIFASASLS